MTALLIACPECDGKGVQTDWQSESIETEGVEAYEIEVPCQCCGGAKQLTAEQVAEFDQAVKASRLDLSHGQCLDCGGPADFSICDICLCQRGA